MSVEVLLKAFEKAKEELGSDKKTHLSTYLSDLLQEEYNYTIGERRLRDYYTDYQKNVPPDAPDLKPKLIECFCRYLGYENYAGYIVHQAQLEAHDTPPHHNTSLNPQATWGKSSWKQTTGPKKYQRKFWVVFVAGLAGSAAYMGLVKDEKECMVWLEDHYEKSICDGESGEVALESIFLERLKKVSVCDTTTFFKNGQPVIWYDIVGGQYEFFTYFGLHPITGNTLRPISRTIIDLQVKPCVNNASDCPE